MCVRAVRTDEVGKGTEDTERADRDEKLHCDLRSQIERSRGAPCEMRLGSERRRHIPQRGDYFAAVRFEDLLLVAAHQVDVELLDADGRQLPELRDVLLRIADHTEALDRFVIDEGGVRRARLGVVLVVVSGPAADIGGAIPRPATSALTRP